MCLNIDRRGITRENRLVLMIVVSMGYKTPKGDYSMAFQ